MLDLGNGWITGIITTVFAAVVGTITFLVRKILTNEKKIAILEFSLDAIDEDIRELRTDVKDILLAMTKITK